MRYQMVSSYDEKLIRLYVVVCCDFLWISFEFLYCYNLSLENVFEVTCLTFLGGRVGRDEVGRRAPA